MIDIRDHPKVTIYSRNSNDNRRYGDNEWIITGTREAVQAYVDEHMSNTGLTRGYGLSYNKLVEIDPPGYWREEGLWMTTGSMSKSSD